MTINWFKASEISEEHRNLPVWQIYLWFVTKDEKIPIVAGSSGNFQLPGGKPENSETFFETINREMFEETGIKVNSYNKTPIMFGYYVAKDDPNWPQFPEYLELRFFVKVDVDSNEIPLSLNERDGDPGHMESVKFADLKTLANEIPWVKSEEEYTEVLRFVV